MPIIRIVPMPGPSGTGGGVSSTVPFELNDTNDDLLLSITKSGTGTTRITAPQDDLALRSARDFIFYPGDDGPGKVYINWGDATYTPNATNEVATLADIDEAVSGITGYGKVKYVDWKYPTQDAVAIQNAINGEAISLKSSDSAAIRWHVRDGGQSTAMWAINAPSIIQQTGELGVGPYQVQFAIDELDFVPPTGYYYNVNYQGPWAGAYICTASTTTTITLEYPGPTLPGANEEFTGGTINPPSIYNQVEADEDGVWIKNADWSSGPAGYSHYWQFTKDGSIHFPYQTSNARTGSGDVLKFATSFDQSIITGAPATTANPTANRLVVAGQDGEVGEGFDGEGGDIYLWAGRGGGTAGGGGDIKIDAGNGAVDGSGGYVKIRGGYSENGYGGFINIDAGDSYTQGGGDVNIRAGQNSTGTASGGQIYIQGGYSADPTLGGDIYASTSQSGKIVLNGAGGEFLNDSSVPGNQIATIGNLGVYSRVIATDGSPLTGDLIHVGKMLYANLTATEAYFLIPTNDDVAFPIGSEIKFMTSDESPWFISAEYGMTTTLVGENSQNTWTGGTFIVPTDSTATLVKVDTERWIISGLRLTDQWWVR